jgi:hypothetical protein
MTISEILATILAFINSAGIVYLLRSNRNNIEAEAEEKHKSGQKLEDEITDRVLARANAELSRLENRLVDVENEFDNLLRGAWTLHQQLLDNHIEPRYVPPRRLKDEGEREKPASAKSDKRAGKSQMGQPR